MKQLGTPGGKEGNKRYADLGPAVKFSIMPAACIRGEHPCAYRESTLRLVSIYQPMLHNHHTSGTSNNNTEYAPNSLVTAPQRRTNFHGGHVDLPAPVM